MPRRTYHAHPASFVMCEACGNTLANPEPAEVSRDIGGDFIVCEHCSHTNRARFADGKACEPSWVASGSDTFGAD